MSANGRKNWKAEATELKEQLKEMTEAAERWKLLASGWREKCHALEDQEMIQLTAIPQPAVEEVERDVVDEPDDT